METTYVNHSLDVDCLAFDVIFPQPAMVVSQEESPSSSQPEDKKMGEISLELHGSPHPY